MTVADWSENLSKIAKEASDELRTGNRKSAPPFFKNLDRLLYSIDAAYDSRNLTNLFNEIIGKIAPEYRRIWLWHDFGQFQMGYIIGGIFGLISVFVSLYQGSLLQGGLAGAIYGGALAAILASFALRLRNEGRLKAISAIPQNLSSRIKQIIPRRGAPVQPQAPRRLLSQRRTLIIIGISALVIVFVGVITILIFANLGVPPERIIPTAAQTIVQITETATRVATQTVTETATRVIETLTPTPTSTLTQPPATATPTLTPTPGVPSVTPFVTPTEPPAPIGMATQAANWLMWIIGGGVMGLIALVAVLGIRSIRGRAAMRKQQIIAQVAPSSQGALSTAPERLEEVITREPVEEVEVDVLEEARKEARAEGVLEAELIGAEIEEAVRAVVTARRLAIERAKNAGVLTDLAGVTTENINKLVEFKEATSKAKAAGVTEEELQAATTTDAVNTLIRDREAAIARSRKANLTIDFAEMTTVEINTLAEFEETLAEARVLGVEEEKLKITETIAQVRKLIGAHLLDTIRAKLNVKIADTRSIMDDIRYKDAVESQRDLTASIAKAQGSLPSEDKTKIEEAIAELEGAVGIFKINAELELIHRARADLEVVLEEAYLELKRPEYEPLTRPKAELQNAIQRAEAVRETQMPGYRDRLQETTQALRQTKRNLVVTAVSESLKQKAMQYKSYRAISEKPEAERLERAKALAEVYETAGVPLSVHFMNRSVNGIRALADRARVFKENEIPLNLLHYSTETALRRAELLRQYGLPVNTGTLALKNEEEVKARFGREIIRNANRMIRLNRMPVESTQEKILETMNRFSILYQKQAELFNKILSSKFETEDIAFITKLLSEKGISSVQVQQVAKESEIPSVTIGSATGSTILPFSKSEAGQGDIKFVIILAISLAIGVIVFLIITKYLWIIEGRSIYPIFEQFLKIKSSENTLGLLFITILITLAVPLSSIYLSVSSLESLVPYLLRALGNTYSDIQSHAIKALVKIGTPAVPYLTRILGDRKENVRLSAIRALGQINDPRVVESLSKALDDKDASVRQAAIQTLGQINNSQATDALFKALNSQYPDVRSLAAKALGKIGPAAKDAVSVLISLLDDPDSSVRSSAARAYINIMNMPESTKENIELLILLLIDEEYREEIVNKLIQIGSPAVPALINALKDKHSVVRSQVIRALGAIGDPKALPALSATMPFLIKRHSLMPESITIDEGIKTEETVMVDYGSEVPPVYETATYYIKEPTIIPNSEYKDTKTEIEILIQVLIKFCLPAVPALIEALKDKDSDIRSSAQEALNKMSSLSQGKKKEFALYMLIGFIEQGDVLHSLFQKLYQDGMYTDVIYNRAITAYGMKRGWTSWQTGSILVTDYGILSNIPEGYREIAHILGSSPDSRKAVSLSTNLSITTGSKPDKFGFIEAKLSSGRASETFLLYTPALNQWQQDPYSQKVHLLGIDPSGSKVFYLMPWGEILSCCTLFGKFEDDHEKMLVYSKEVLAKRAYRGLRAILEDIAHSYSLYPSIPSDILSLVQIQNGSTAIHPAITEEFMRRTGITSKQEALSVLTAILTLELENPIDAFKFSAIVNYYHNISGHAKAINTHIEEVGRIINSPQFSSSAVKEFEAIIAEIQGIQVAIDKDIKDEFKVPFISNGRFALRNLYELLGYIETEGIVPYEGAISSYSREPGLAIRLLDALEEGRINIEVNYLDIETKQQRQIIWTEEYWHMDFPIQASIYLTKSKHLSSLNAKHSGMTPGQILFAFDTTRTDTKSEVLVKSEEDALKQTIITHIREQAKGKLGGILKVIEVLLEGEGLLPNEQAIIPAIENMKIELVRGPPSSFIKSKDSYAVARLITNQDGTFTLQIYAPFYKFLKAQKDPSLIITLTVDLFLHELFESQVAIDHSIAEQIELAISGDRLNNAIRLFIKRTDRAKSYREHNIPVSTSTLLYSTETALRRAELLRQYGLPVNTGTLALKNEEEVKARFSREILRNARTLINIEKSGIPDESKKQQALARLIYLRKAQEALFDSELGRLFNEDADLILSLLQQQLEVHPAHAPPAETATSIPGALGIWKIFNLEPKDLGGIGFMEGAFFGSFLLWVLWQLRIFSKLEDITQLFIGSFELTGIVILVAGIIFIAHLLLGVFLPNGKVSTIRSAGFKEHSLTAFRAALTAFIGVSLTGALTLSLIFLGLPQPASIIVGVLTGAAVHSSINWSAYNKTDKEESRTLGIQALRSMFLGIFSGIIIVIILYSVELLLGFTALMIPLSFVSQVVSTFLTLIEVPNKFFWILGIMPFSVYLMESFFRAGIYEGLKSNKLLKLKTRSDFILVNLLQASIFAVVSAFFMYTSFPVAFLFFFVFFIAGLAYGIVYDKAGIAGAVNAHLVVSIFSLLSFQDFHSNAMLLALISGLGIGLGLVYVMIAPKAPKAKEVPEPPSRVLPRVQPPPEFSSYPNFWEELQTLTTELYISEEATEGCAFIPNPDTSKSSPRLVWYEHSTTPPQFIFDVETLVKPIEKIIGEHNRMTGLRAFNLVNSEETARMLLPIAILALEWERAQLSRIIELQPTSVETPVILKEMLLSFFAVRRFIFFPKYIRWQLIEFYKERDVKFAQLLLDVNKIIEKETVTALSTREIREMRKNVLKHAIGIKIHDYDEEIPNLLDYAAGFINQTTTVNLTQDDIELIKEFARDFLDERLTTYGFFAMSRQRVIEDLLKLWHEEGVVGIVKENELQATLNRIKRSHNYVETGKVHWDYVLLGATRRGNAKATLNEHIGNFPELYNRPHTNVNVVERPDLGKDGKGKQISTGNFDFPVWIMREFMFGDVYRALAYKVYRAIGDDITTLNDTQLSALLQQTQLEVHDEQLIIDNEPLTAEQLRSPPVEQLLNELWRRPASRLLLQQVARQGVPQGLHTNAKVVIILDGGSGSRVYPLSIPSLSKGGIYIPRSLNSKVLELTDEVFVQSHQMLEDTLPGSFTVLTNDQFWALGSSTSGTPDKHGLQVYGSQVSMRPVLEEMVRLGWLDTKVLFSSEVSVRRITGEEDLLKDTLQQIDLQPQEALLMDERLDDYLNYGARTVEQRKQLKSHKDRLKYFTSLINELERQIKTPKMTKERRDLLIEQQSEIKRELSKFKRKIAEDYASFVAQARRDAPTLFFLTELGHFDMDSQREDEIINMIEKPTNWSLLRPLLQKGYSNLNWWDHRWNRQGILALLELDETFNFVGKDMDFSIDFLEALSFEDTEEALDTWIKQRPEKDSEGNVIYPRENHQWQFKLAQEFKHKAGAAQYLRGAYFIDVGTVRNLLDTYLRRLDPSMSKIIEAFLKLHHDPDKPIIIDSPEVEQAIRENRLKVAPGAIVIGSSIQRGNIDSGSLVINTHLDYLDCDSDAIVYHLVGLIEDVYVPSGYVATMVPVEGEEKFDLRLDRIDMDPRSPSGAYGQLKDRTSNADRYAWRQQYYRAPAWWHFHLIDDRLEWRNQASFVLRDYLNAARFPDIQQAMYKKLHSLANGDKENSRSGAKWVLEQLEAKRKQTVKGIIINITGFSAGGKSTVAKILATKLGGVCIDVGDIYRLFVWKILREANGDPSKFNDPSWIINITNQTTINIQNGEFVLDGKPISESELYTKEVEEIVKDKILRQSQEIRILIDATAGWLIDSLSQQSDVLVTVRGPFEKSSLNFFLDVPFAERINRYRARIRGLGEEISQQNAERAVEERDRGEDARQNHPEVSFIEIIDRGQGQEAIAEAISQRVQIEIQPGKAEHAMSPRRSILAGLTAAGFSLLSIATIVLLIVVLHPAAVLVLIPVGYGLHRLILKPRGASVLVTALTLLGIHTALAALFLGIYQPLAIRHAKAEAQRGIVRGNSFLIEAWKNPKILDREAFLDTMPQYRARYSQHVAFRIGDTLVADRAVLSNLSPVIQASIYCHEQAPTDPAAYIAQSLYLFRDLFTQDSVFDKRIKQGIREIIKRPGARFEQDFDKAVTIKRAGRFYVQLNPQRRPPSEHDFRGPVIEPFDPSAFRFVDKPYDPQDPSANRQYLFHKTIDGADVLFQGNRNPYGRDHFVIIPEPSERHPQVLTEQAIRIGSSVQRDLSRNPRLIIEFNSWGGLASANQLHLHGMSFHHRTVPMAKAKQMLRYHNGNVSISSIGDGVQDVLQTTGIGRRASSLVNWLEKQLPWLKKWGIMWDLPEKWLNVFPMYGLVFEGDDIGIRDKLVASYVELLQKQNMPHRVIWLPDRKRIVVLPHNRDGIEKFRERMFEIPGELLEFDKRSFTLADERKVYEAGHSISLSKDKFESLFALWISKEPSMLFEVYGTVAVDRTFEYFSENIGEGKRRHPLLASIKQMTDYAMTNIPKASDLPPAAREVMRLELKQRIIARRQVLEDQDLNLSQRLMEEAQSLSRDYLQGPSPEKEGYKRVVKAFERALNILQRVKISRQFPKELCEEFKRGSKALHQFIVDAGKTDMLPHIDLVVVTSNRPEQLEALLTSVVTYLETIGYAGIDEDIHTGRLVYQKIHIAIVDDSSNLDAWNRNQEIVERFNKLYNLDLTYVGPNEVRELARMVKETLGEDLSDFLNKDKKAIDDLENPLAINGRGPFGNRNVSMLSALKLREQHPGAHIFRFLDDDTQLLNETVNEEGYLIDDILFDDFLEVIRIGEARPDVKVLDGPVTGDGVTIPAYTYRGIVRDLSEFFEHASGLAPDALYKPPARTTSLAERGWVFDFEAAPEQGFVVLPREGEQKTVREQTREYLMSLYEGLVGHHPSRPRLLVAPNKDALIGPDEEIVWDIIEEVETGAANMTMFELIPLPYLEGRRRQDIIWNIISSTIGGAKVHRGGNRIFHMRRTEGAINLEEIAKKQSEMVANDVFARTYHRVLEEFFKIYNVRSIEDLQRLSEQISQDATLRTKIIEWYEQAVAERWPLIEANYNQMLQFINEIEGKGYFTDTRYWWNQDPSLKPALISARAVLNLLKTNFDPKGPVLQKLKAEFISESHKSEKIDWFLMLIVTMPSKIKRWGQIWKASEEFFRKQASKTTAVKADEAAAPQHRAVSPGALGFWPRFGLANLGWIGFAEGVVTSGIELLLLFGLMPNAPPSSIIFLIIPALLSIFIIFFGVSTLLHKHFGVLQPDLSIRKNWKSARLASLIASSSLLAAPIMFGLMSIGIPVVLSAVIGIISGATLHAALNNAQLFIGPKVILVNLVAPEYAAERQWPIAVNTLAGHLRKYTNAQVTVIDMDKYLIQVDKDFAARGIPLTAEERFKKATDLVIEEIKKTPVDILGLAMKWGTLGVAEDIVKGVKKELAGNTPLILPGNVIATFAGTELLDRGVFEDAIIVRGEGEMPLQEIVTTMAKNRFSKDRALYVHIPNLILKVGDEVVHTDRAVMDLSSYALPDEYEARELFSVLEEPNIPIEASRGCPYSACTFCSIRELIGHSAWRPFPVDEVLTRMGKFAKMGIRKFHFVDSEFMGPVRTDKEFEATMARAEALAKGIIKLNEELNLKGEDRITITHLSTRVDTISQPKRPNRTERMMEVWGLMKQAGLQRVYLGIESGSPTQLRRFGKKATVQQNEEAIERFSGLGIAAEPGFIFFDYLATLQELKENLEFIERTRLYETNSRIFGSLRLQKGSPYVKLAQNRHLMTDRPLDIDFVSYEARYQNPEIGEIESIFREWESQTRKLVKFLYALQRIEPDPARKRLLAEFVSRIRYMDFAFMKDLINTYQDIDSRSRIIIKHLESTGEMLLEIKAALEEGRIADKSGRLKTEFLPYSSEVNAGLIEYFSKAEAYLINVINELEVSEEARLRLKEDLKNGRIVFAILKPEVAELGLIGELKEILGDSFDIIHQEERIITKEVAMEHYRESRDKEYFAPLVRHITSGPATLLLLRGDDDAVFLLRTLLGPKATGEQEELLREAQRGGLNIEEEKDSMIRTHYGIVRIAGLARTYVHASRTPQEVMGEMQLHFNREELKAIFTQYVTTSPQRQYDSASALNRISASALAYQIEQGETVRVKNLLDELRKVLPSYHSILLRRLGQLSTVNGQIKSFLDAEEARPKAKCVICSLSAHKKLYTIRAYDTDYNIVQCQGCGLVFIANPPTPEQIREIYASGYFDGQVRAKSGAKFGYTDYLSPDQRRMRLFFAGMQAAYLTKRYPRKGRLLEIGCAAGYLLQRAKEFGWNVLGIEVAKDASEYARREFGIEVINGTFESAQLPGKFDAVVLVDTLEHMVNPNDALRNINNLLVDDGLVFIKVPDINSEVAQAQGEDWEELKVVHLYYFSPDTIRRLLAQNGFEVLEILTDEQLEAASGIQADEQLMRDLGEGIRKMRKGTMGYHMNILARKKTDVAQTAAGAFGFWPHLGLTDLRWIGFVEGMVTAGIELLLLFGLMPNAPPSDILSIVIPSLLGISLILFGVSTLLHKHFGVLQPNLTIRKDWKSVIFASLIASSSLLAAPIMFGLMSIGIPVVLSAILSVISGAAIHAALNSTQLSRKDTLSAGMAPVKQIRILSEPAIPALPVQNEVFVTDVDGNVVKARIEPLTSKNMEYNALSILEIPEVYDWVLEAMRYKYTELGIPDGAIEGTLRILKEYRANPEEARSKVLERYNYLDPDSIWAKKMSEDNYLGRVAKIRRFMRGERIVDAGCGDNGFGNALLEAKDHPDNMTVIGTDRFSEGHEYRRRILEKAPHLLYRYQENDFELPVESNWATTLARFSVYHHMPYTTQEIALQEDRRVLEEGGRLIVFEDIFDREYEEDTPLEGRELAARVPTELRPYIIPIVRFSEWFIVRILLDKPYLQVIYPRTKEGWIAFFTNGGFEVEGIYTEFPKGSKSLIPRGIFILKKVSKNAVEKGDRPHFPDRSSASSIFSLISSLRALYAGLVEFTKKGELNVIIETIGRMLNRPAFVNLKFLMFGGRGFSAEQNRVLNEDSIGVIKMLRPDISEEEATRINNIIQTRFKEYTILNMLKTPAGVTLISFILYVLFFYNPQIDQYRLVPSLLNMLTKIFALFSLSFSLIMYLLAVGSAVRMFPDLKNTILIYPNVDINEFKGNAYHELVHFLKSMKYIKRDVAIAPAVEKLLTEDISGTKNKYIIKGISLMKEIRDPSVRMRTAERLARGETGLLVNLLHILSPEPPYSYFLGNMMAGMAWELANQTGRPGDGVKYLRLLAIGIDEVTAERFVRDNTEPKPELYPKTETPKNMFLRAFEAIRKKL